MSEVILIWARIAGQTPEGEPIIEKCPLSEPPPENAWAAEQDVDAWKDEILAELEMLDRKSIRALRDGSKDRLDDIESRAQKLRGYLRMLTGA